MTAPRTTEPLWNSWKPWKSAVKGVPYATPLGIVPIGYFRKRDRSKGIWYPVGIWIEPDGVKVAQVGQGKIQRFETAEQEEDFDVNTMAHITKTPIPYEAYRHWMDNRVWPEGSNYDPISAGRGERETPTIGDNSGALPGELDAATGMPIEGAPAADPEALTLERFLTEQKALIARLDALKTPATKEEADKAQDLRSELTTLASEADKVREAEKAPHLAAGKAVDEAWNPTIKETRQGATTLKSGIDALAAKIGREAAEAAAEKAKAGNPDLDKPAPVLFGSGSGRKAQAKEYRHGEIEDQDLVYAQLRANPEIIALIQKLCDKVTASGASLKGVTYTMRTRST